MTSSLKMASSRRLIWLTGLWLVVLTVLLFLGYYLVVGRLLVENIEQSRSVARNVLISAPSVLIVLLAYLAWRLQPFFHLYSAVLGGDTAGAAQREQAARLAMNIPPSALVGGLMTALFLSLIMLGASPLLEGGVVNTAALRLLVAQALFLAGGLGYYLILRYQLRPALIAIRVAKLPVKRLFGVRPRLMLSTLFLTAIGAAAVLAFYHHSVGSLLTRSGQLFSQLVARPLISQSGLFTAFLLAVFSAVTGWLLGQESRKPAVALTKILSRMGSEGRDPMMERLPVHSTTEVGRIAVAYNQLANRLDSEHAKLNAYAEQILKTERIRSRFLANMSHELRTPLNSIIGFSDLLLRGLDGELNQRQKEDIGVINQEGGRLLGLINDILLMARLEAGRYVLSEEDFDLSMLLREAFAAVTPPPTALLEQEVAPRLKRGWLRGDRPKLARALAALIEYASAAVGDAKMRVVAEVLGGEVLCLSVVCPTIPPPDPAEGERLFEGFRRVGITALTAHGIGIGLPLARRISRAYGGEAAFTKTGEGCAIEMKLPGLLAAGGEDE